MKIKIDNYTFDKTAKTVTFTDYATIRLDCIAIVTNVTVNPHIVIYIFSPPLLGGTNKGGTVSGNVLTVDYDTSAMSNTDKLLIVYYDAALSLLVTPSLPTGAATSAKQDTEIAGLASILAKILTAPATEAKQDTLIAKDFATQTTLAAVLAKIISAPSTEATLASVLAKIISAPATEAKQDTLIAKDYATQTTLSALVTEFQFDNKIGSLTETAPASDTASSGLNGRLQRLAQRITSLIALLPTALGQSIMSNSLRVAIASDQSKVPVANGEISVTGQGSQTTLNNNILSASSTTSSTDVVGYTTFSIQINTESGTVTAGVISFEGSNDDVNFVPFSVKDISNNSNVFTYTVLASTQKIFIGQSLFRYIRARISTGITGTTTGVQAITRRSSLYSSDGSVNVGSALPTGANVIGKVSIDQTTPGTTNAIRNTAGTTGGATPYKLISAASTNATSVKGSAGTLYGIQVYNTNASARYLKLYNKASSPTVGTDVPVKVITIPGSTSGAGSNVPIPSVGVAFGTGLALALTTGAADADTGAVAASEIIVNLDYN